MSARQQTELTQAFAALRPYQVQVMVWSLATAVLSLAPSIYMFQVYDRVVNSRNLTTLLMLTLLVVGSYVAMVLLDSVREEILQRASRRLDQQLAVRVFDAVFAAHARQARVGGDQHQNDLKTLRDFVVSPAAQAFLELPGAALFLVCTFLINPMLGYAALAGAVVQFLLAFWTEQRTHAPLTEANRASTHANLYVSGALYQAQVIESMGMLRGVHERWMRRQRKFLALQAQASDKAGSSGALSRTVQIVQGSALLGIGCWLTLNGLLPAGGAAMIVASILGGKVLQPLVKGVSQWKLIVQARDARDRLDEFLARFPARAEQMQLPAPTGRLSVEGLVVGAPGQGPAGRPALLRNIAFQLQAGTVMAVVGPSGAGKTTLAKALLGLLPSMGGKVRLDGIDVHERDKELLGEHLGYLPQEVALFDGTLAENIARFGAVDADRLDAACRSAGLTELIAQWPEGAETPIGPAGAFLSGGERQRVGLARAVYGEPALVILDEPYSNLDDQGEAMVLALVRQLKQRGTTVILITHLPSMLSVADAVMVIRDGTMLTVGPRDEVMAAMAKARDARAAAPAARLQAQEVA